MKKNKQIIPTVIILSILLIVTISHAYTISQMAAFFLLWIIPAYYYANSIRANRREEQLLTAFALTLFINSIGSLLIHYLPGKISQLQLIIFTILHISTAIKLNKNAPQPATFSRSYPPYLLFFILVGILFRFTYLGYSELQGDEAVALVRTADMISGDQSELFLHQKGPIELLIPLPAWVLTNQINEFWARAPFAWASILSLAALFLLTEKWLGRNKGWPTVALFLISGFSIAFARIVQYQSFVLLWSILALIQATNYYQTSKKESLYLTAVFLAAALLSHYDAILITPAIAFLIFTPIIRKKEIVWKDWLIAISIGLLLLSLFYIPFITNPNFARTLDYLISDRVGANESRNWQNWSGGRVWQMMTFYNSSYYILLLFFLILANLLPNKDKTATQYRLPIFLTFAVPIIFYMFIVVDPRTHIYTFFPGATILAGSGFFRLHSYLPQRPLTLLFSFIWLISTWYCYLLFIDHTPNKTIPAFYWHSWETAPEYGLFGFPHQSGWRQLRHILPEESLLYASNEEKEVTQWYLQQASRTHCPNYSHFILANEVQDPIPYDATTLSSQPISNIISIQSTNSITIYSATTTGTTYSSADQRQLWQSPTDVAHSPPQPQFPTNLPFYERGTDQLMVTLLGYDYQLQQQQIWITLYWEANAPFNDNYQTFVHFYDGTKIWAQDDTAPECTHNPTTRWEPGQFIADPHRLLIPKETPPNTLFYAGLYHLLTGERLYTPDYPNEMAPLPIPWEQ